MTDQLVVVLMWTHPMYHLKKCWNTNRTW